MQPISPANDEMSSSDCRQIAAGGIPNTDIAYSGANQLGAGSIACSRSA